MSYRIVRLTNLNIDECFPSVETLCQITAPEESDIACIRTYVDDSAYSVYVLVSGHSVVGLVVYEYTRETDESVAVLHYLIPLPGCSNNQIVRELLRHVEAKAVADGCIHLDVCQVMSGVREICSERGYQVHEVSDDGVVLRLIL